MTLRPRPIRRHPSFTRRPPLPKGLVDALRPHLRAAVQEMAGEIRTQVPEYAWDPGSANGRRMQETVLLTVERFVDSLDRPADGGDSLRRMYAQLGAHEARSGRGLDDLQAALRVSSQVACRRFIKDAYRLGWSRETLALLTDAVFLLVEEVTRAAVEGYAAAQGELAGQVERHRTRLRDLLVADPAMSREALVALARAAEWGPPRSLAVVALCGPAADAAGFAPPMVLADWTGPAPFLVVPDPEGPGRDRLLGTLLDGRSAAVGPTVDLTRGAVSLRWARRAVALMDRGVLPADGALRCVDHIATLVASMSEDLIELAAERCLVPLLALPPARREALARTLLAYLQCGDNAVTAGERLHIHQQTVRYRMRRLHELYGGELCRPETRLEMMIALTHLLEFDGRPAAAVHEDAQAATRGEARSGVRYGRRPKPREGAEAVLDSAG